MVLEKTKYLSPAEIRTPDRPFPSLVTKLISNFGSHKHPDATKISAVLLSTFLFYMTSVTHTDAATYMVHIHIHRIRDIEKSIPYYQTARLRNLEFHNMHLHCSGSLISHTFNSTYEGKKRKKMWTCC
jgi:hypothetical protein